MDKAIGKLNGRTLSKVTITRKSGEGEAIVSNFDIKFQTVKIEEYGRFDGVCIDGQHRTLALQFADLKEQSPTY